MSDTPPGVRSLVESLDQLGVWEANFKRNAEGEWTVGIRYLPTPELLAIELVKVDQEPCTAQIKVGHETFECWAERQHPGMPHMVLLGEPCPTCGGYDEHAETCSTLEVVSRSDDHYSWSDGDEALTLVPYEAWQAWRDQFFRPVT